MIPPSFSCNENRRSTIYFSTQECRSHRSLDSNLAIVIRICTANLESLIKWEGSLREAFEVGTPLHNDSLADQASFEDTILRIRSSIRLCFYDHFSFLVNQLIETDCIQVSRMPPANNLRIFIRKVWQNFRRGAEDRWSYAWFRWSAFTSLIGERKGRGTGRTQWPSQVSSFGSYMRIQ